MKPSPWGIKPPLNWYEVICQEPRDGQPGYLVWNYYPTGWPQHPTIEKDKSWIAKYTYQDWKERARPWTFGTWQVAVWQEAGKPLTERKPIEEMIPTSIITGQHPATWADVSEASAPHIQTAALEKYLSELRESVKIYGWDEGTRDISRIIVNELSKRGKPLSDISKTSPETRSLVYRKVPKHLQPKGWEPRKPYPYEMTHTLEPEQEMYLVNELRLLYRRQQQFPLSEEMMKQHVIRYAEADLWLALSDEDVTRIAHEAIYGVKRETREKEREWRPEVEGHYRCTKCSWEGYLTWRQFLDTIKRGGCPRCGATIEQAYGVKRETREKNLAHQMLEVSEELMPPRW